MKLKSSFLSSLLGIVASVSLYKVLETSSSYAQANPPPPACNPTTDLTVPYSLCTTAARNYQVRFYQIGMCTSNPLLNAAPDTSSCFIIYNNAAGQVVDIGTDNPLPVQLVSLPSNQRPENIEYPYIFIIWGNTVGIRGQATVSNGTYYTSSTSYNNPNYLSQGNLATVNSANYAIYSDTLNFLSNDGINAICTDPNNGVGGRISVLTSSNQPITPAGNTCPGAARIAVSARSADILGSSLRITSNVKGIRFKFSAPEAIGLYANLVDPNNVYSGYDYVYGFRGFRVSMTFVD